MPMYHYRLPSGEEYATDNLARLKREHPDARITGRVETNAVGDSVVVPFRGEQPGEGEERRLAENLVEYEAMNVADLKQELERREIAFDGGMRKQRLIDLLAQDDAAAVRDDVEAPARRQPEETGQPVVDSDAADAEAPAPDAPSA